MISSYGYANRANANSNISAAKFNAFIINPLSDC